MRAHGALQQVCAGLGPGPHVLFRLPPVRVQASLDFFSVWFCHRLSSGVFPGAVCWPVLRLVSPAIQYSRSMQAVLVRTGPCCGCFPPPAWRARQPFHLAAQAKVHHTDTQRLAAEVCASLLLRAVVQAAGAPH